MAYELHGMLTGAVSLTTWEKVMPAYGGQPESFLNNVVTPIYRVISEVLLDCPLSLYLFLSKN
jgi:callose synthase